MDAEAWIGLVAVGVAIATIGVMYHLSRRNQENSRFIVSWRPTPSGWLLSAFNASRSEAYLAWFDLVLDPDGHAFSIESGTPTRVAVGGSLRATVSPGRGYGVELCWLDRDGEEYRLPIALPERPQSGNKRRRGRGRSAD